MAAFAAVVALSVIGVNPADSATPPTAVMVANPEPSHGLWQITVYGTARDDSVDVGFKDGRYVIASPDGVDFYDSAVGCESESPAEVRCTLPYGQRVVVALDLGDDDLDLSGPVRSWSPGGGGSDTIDGSPARNVMIGGAGRDRLSGREGDDRLIGTGGKRGTGGAGDSLQGNAGDDLLSAGDGERDKGIACGPGDDRAIVDRGHIERRHR